MDDASQGAQFNQLARLLFNAAAIKWTVAVGLEMVASILAGVLALWNLPTKPALVGAVVGLILLGAAYVLRLWFEDQYDTAGTMLRQAAFSEGLGWSIAGIQASEWRRKAGHKILARLAAQPRPSDYYATQAMLGPKRLLDMTLESAFYTRHIYLKLRACVWALFVGAAVIAIVVMLITLTQVLPENAQLFVAHALYAFIPLVLTFNLLGWSLRLTRLADAICDIEDDLERLRTSPDLTVEQVTRLRSEYNCQLVGGFPTPDYLYAYWSNEIKVLWDQRWQDLCQSN